MPMGTFDNRSRWLLIAVAMLCGGTQLAAGAAATDDDDLVVISTGAQPRLACDVHRDGRMLEVVVEVAALNADGSGVEPTVGLAATKSKLLPPPDAKVKRGDHRARFTWTVTGSDLVDSPADWKRLRMGIDVRWTGGPNGGDRRHERYGHVDAGAPSAGLSSRPADWAPLDMDELALQQADRRDRLLIALDQPMDGKLTVVIEDLEGRRIRNLVSGVTAVKGPQRVEWDGCDEDGRLVKEGRYRWRSIHHPGIVPDYVTSFCNADEPGFRALLSNHCHFIAAAANEERVVLAAVGTEGGFAMGAFDREGHWRQGYNPILGAGWTAVAVALDSNRLYAAHDGEGWGMSINKTMTNWTAEVALTLTRFDLDSGAVVEYPGGKRWSELERHSWGPGAAEEPLRTKMSLTGIALVEGKLYVGSRAANALLVVDAATGKQVDAIPLAQPGSLAACGKRLIAVSAGRPMEVTIVGHVARPLFTPETERVLGLDALDIRALALAEDGRVFMADGRSHTVKIVTPDGKVDTLGQPDGAYAGTWQPERMVDPSGLALLAGRLWVAEDRTLPKRAVAWDLATRKVIRQVFGNPAYGGPGAGFDPKDPTRWVGEGAAWRLDLQRGTADCLGILGWTATGPMHWRFIRQEGRTYLLGMGMANVLTLLQEDGTLRPVAIWAACHHFSYAYNWWPPNAFVEAFTAAYPQLKYKVGTWGRPDHGPGMLWVDRNGDGAMQQEEFEFSGAANVGGGSWGHDVSDLTIRLPGDAEGKPLVVTLKPDGVDARGVPCYPHLAEAVAGAVKLQSPPRFNGGFRNVSSATRGGDLVVLSEPMTCWSPEGRLQWRYPNKWSNVHGSHGAPLPETGVLQGALFVLGMAPLDERTDVFIINGNHGRFFVMTSDGLYLDEMFNDCRVAQSVDAMLIGGECFGGVFGRADDGGYWLQTGGNGFRVYRVNGLDKLRRGQGEVTVEARQLIAAQRRAERHQAGVAVARVASLEPLQKPPVGDGSGNGWPAGDPLVWDRSGGANRVAVRLGCDATYLYMRYEVTDPSPWVNNGTDWTLLFKTGDSVDLQLGTDPGADPHRNGPVPGDIRLLIAPMGTQNVAVVYRHRVPGTKQGMAFSSPWRTETVDVVKRLEGVRIGVQKVGDGYRMEAAVPLTELGFAPKAGGVWKADLGVIYGDDAGTINLSRNYWANETTGLVNDVPGEIMLHPDLWGTLKMEAP